MSKRIIVNANITEEVRIAIIENDKLIDIDIEIPNRTKQKGNIFKGIVTNIEDGLEAAFVEFGESKQAFLPLSEIRYDLSQLDVEILKKFKQLKVSDILTPGQEIVIQITKDKTGTKGAAATTYLSLPGRYIVLMHSDNTGGGISRKITNDNSRKIAKEILFNIEIPIGMAIIIRTAGITATKIDLMRDFKNLCKTWEEIDRNNQSKKAPLLLYEEPNVIIRTIRDYFTDDVSLIAIDDNNEYQNSLKYFKEYIPGMENLLTYYEDIRPIFASYNIAKEVKQLYETQVMLSSGGCIVIEQTEALVSIDVNSGRSIDNDGHEATVYKTNMEASKEIARQLRLRDLGGIIVIDFIDMVSKIHKKNIEKQLIKNMSSDKARIKIGMISENGLLEITRQRLRQSHRMVSHISCDSCNGTGRIRDIDGRVINALRHILNFLSKARNGLCKLSIYLPIDVANLLNNGRREYLLKISELYKLELFICGDIKLNGETIRFNEERVINVKSLLKKSDRKIDRDMYRNNNMIKNYNIDMSHMVYSIGAVPVLKQKNYIKKNIYKQNNKVIKIYNDLIAEAIFGNIYIKEDNNDKFNKERKI